MRSIMAAALALAAPMAHAQTGGPQCAPTEAMVKVLADDYGEAPIGFGLSGPGMFVLFAASDGATWTLTVNRGAALCVLAAGTQWQSSPATAPKKGGGA